MAEHRGTPLTLLERWRAAEPVRLALYPVIVSFVAWLVYRGLIVASEAPLILAVIAGLLGTAATEVARSQVDSPATVAERDRAAYAAGVRDALRATPDSIANRQQGGAVED